MNQEIEGIYKLVVKMFLDIGKIPPLIFVDLGNNKPYVIPHVSEDFCGGTAEKASSLFWLGKEFAEDQHIEGSEVKKLFFASQIDYVEQWINDGKDEHFARETESRATMPAGEKKQGVSVMELCPHTRSIEQKMHLAQVVESGNVVDLLPVRIDSSRSILLPSFFAGIERAGRSDESILREVESHRARSGQ